MNTKERIARILLILAGVGLAASILLALVKIAALMGVYNPGQLDVTRWLQLSLGITVILAAVFAILDPERVRVFLTGRQAHYGSNAALSIIAFSLILFLVNWYVYRNPVSKDLTADQANTLAPETVELLGTLTKEVKALAFYSTGSLSTEDRTLLDLFSQNSNGLFTYQVIDPQLDPLTAEQYSATDGSIVFQMGESTEQAAFATEDEFDAALIRLLYPADRVIYFLSGHGEASLEGFDEFSLSRVKSALEGKNYTVKPLNLIASPAIPEDALAIVIAGPLQPVSQDEVDLLKAYLDGGGSLIVEMEPLPLTDFGDAPDPLSQYLETGWGVTFENNVVVDTATNQPLIAVASEYATHPITDKLRGVVAVFPTARSVKLAQVSEYIEQIELIRTGENSWGESDLVKLDTEGVTDFDEGADLIGPVALAAVAENYENNARLVVFGDSEFAQDGMYDTYGNGSLLINTIDWAAQQEDLIALTPKNRVERIYNLPTQGQTLAILLGSVCLIPLLVIVAGAAAWVRRKRRG
ncbi:MAG: GldG family protein [Chloroflexota bacterium]